MNNNSLPLIVRQLGNSDYLPIWQAMQDFTNNRNEDSQDEIWLVEHNSVFTQGQAGKAEHVLMPGDIEVVNVDRGGQVTYHGPGQQVVYLLINIKRRKLGVRQLVSAMESAVVNSLAEVGITAYAKKDAPGVYVEERKICSLGLRIRKGCSFHGLALNIDMDLSPFSRINPCGYAGMEMTDCKKEGVDTTLSLMSEILIQELLKVLSINDIQNIEGFNE